ncbi:hypothetical protein F4774DRAFT_375745 [Daldinia eschscholtzii]|nr:hypothetical protein F4774DRAFT_375745 [Daldinia eschscholtzii]
MVCQFLDVIGMEAATLGPLSHPCLMKILELRNPDLYELIGCNDLSRLVLRRSEHGILNLLRSNYSLVDYCMGGTITALHLAVIWPKGLSLLIEHGGEYIQSIINGCNGSLSPLHYAMYLAEVDSIVLLLNAGASISPQVFHGLDCIHPVERAEKITHVVVESFARQCKDLLQMALQYLPTETIEKLELRNEELLDDKALIVAKALRQQRVPIPAAYDFLEHGSVYHSGNLTARIAQKFFEVGFCKISSRLHGHTPLMNQAQLFNNLKVFLDLASWFKDHGDNFHAPVHVPNDISHSRSMMKNDITPYGNPSRSSSTTHFLMFRLGELIYECLYHPNLQQECIRNHPLIPSLFGDDITDSCACYCAAQGCTPTSKFFISIVDQARYLGHDKYVRLFGMIQLVEPTIPKNDKYRVSLEYIRLATHWHLGMRHTCCQLKGYHDYRGQKTLVRFLDKNEIDEIQGEERYLAQQLETLVEEFEKKFRELNVPLSQFMEEYQFPRLEEIRKERGELSSNELQAIRETGVVLHDDEEEEEEKEESFDVFLSTCIRAVMLSA